MPTRRSVSQLTLAPLTDVDIGALAATAIAIAAYRTRSLDLGGAVAAIAVGTATYAALGFAGAVVLVTFFASSVALSRVGKRRKTTLLIDVAKTGPRDAAQVFANGGVATACALAALWLDARYAVGFAGAFAAATADTWGTEIGTLARGMPRSILTFRPIATGLSGGITRVGTFAEVAGAIAIAGVAVVANLAASGAAGTHEHAHAHAHASALRLAVAVATGGFAGALADSLLGASVQARRWCPQCERATEREPHGCGANTAPLRGLSWFGNDAVNFTATLVGASVARTLAR